MINIITNISIILIYVLVIIAVFTKKKVKNENTKLDYFINKYHIFILISIFIIALFIRLYDISELPKGLHCDEAGMAYDAYCLSEYGVDRYLNNNPIYLINFGGGQSVFYAFLTSIFIKLFGLSTIIIRLPAVLLSLTSIIIFYLLIKENINKKAALLGAFLITICPWHIMMSRWGLDCNLLFSLLLISIYFLVRAKKTIHYLIAGIFIGISLYTYILSYIIIPIFLLLTICYMLIIKKIKFRSIIILGIPVFILALPLICLIFLNNGWIDKNIFSFLSIPKLPIYRINEVNFSNILNNLKSLFQCLISGDSMIYNTITETGSIYYMSIPFLLIGFADSIINTIKSIKQRKFSLDAVILFSFLSVVICMCITSEPNINKSNAIFISIIYFITIGLISIAKNNRKILITVLLIYIINFISFYIYYCTNFKNTNNHIFKYYFNNQISNVTQYLNNEEKFFNKDIYFCTNDTPQPYIYVLLANKTSPYIFDKTKVVRDYNLVVEFDKYHFYHIDTISDDNIYVLNKNDKSNIEMLKELGFILENYKEYVILYKY